MQFEFSIHVDGEGFDPQQFNDSVDPAAKGSVRTVRQVARETVARPPTYWQSKVVPVVAGDANDAICELLKLLRPQLLALRELPRVRILASVAGYYGDIESLHGFFFPAEIMRLLAEIGAGFDLDLVPSAEFIQSAGS